ncbi:MULTISPECIES: hypothetical protein [unclassified Fibrobacter]|uniref:hypothetical protein n=1 Tax=unclassified Fibrobacter TaxID=2634177 RepID=UPI000D6D3340|nr:MULTISPECIES: hypothetical protein [unclassified Fibrobacter]PWJ60991.1 hypothetical protein BGX12_13221 [Fibrobacter sp. UWR4]PZW65486.1 hypothetical protein C8E88_103421 [Fibrobacter sp. UWR1]
MKKFIAPAVLFVLALALVIYLCGGLFGNQSSFDSRSYLDVRSKIDSLEIALWDAQHNPEAQVAIRAELDASWDTLASLRRASEKKTVDADAPVQDSGVDVLPAESIKWVVGGVVAIILCIVLLVFILKRRKEYLTRQMETIKTEVPAVNSREDEATLVPPTPRPKKTSIIADAEAYAARKRETLAQQAQPASQAAAPQTISQAKPVEPPKAEQEEIQKVAFEDENGLPENKILTGFPSSKPTLRPTARQRITSAMQNLSDVLRAPRGLSRDVTMKLRAQSRNATGDPKLAGSNPLETSRFDREDTEKVRILQLSRRGFPASAIASTLKIPQDKVEAIIKENQI